MVTFTRPFYDGMGKPLIGATITLCNENGTIIFYSMTEQTGEGMSGVYSVSIIDVSRQYWIWVKEHNLTISKCIGNFSPKFIASSDL